MLVNGAGGGSGIYAIQLAKLHRAEVTGVDNAEKLEFMRSLGADHVIDYTRDDFTGNGRCYDLILDLAAHRPVAACMGSLTPGGRYLYVGGSVATLLQILLVGPLIGRSEGKKIRLLAGKRWTMNRRIEEVAWPRSSSVGSPKRASASGRCHLP